MNPQKQLTKNQRQALARKQYEQQQKSYSRVQNVSLFQNFMDIADQKAYNLSINIVGDYSYVRNNKYSVKNKVKILDYLQEKYLLMSHQLQQKSKKGYYIYNPQFFKRKPTDLKGMKDMLLQGKSQVQMAEQNLRRLKSSKQYIRAKFLNEAAYQFDKQRYCSIMWGLVFGSIINSTIYKKGTTPRKAALVVTIAHIFGQISYHINLDKYFDSEANLYMKQEEKNIKQKQRKTYIGNIID